MNKYEGELGEVRDQARRAAWKAWSAACSLGWSADSAGASYSTWSALSPHSISHSVVSSAARSASGSESELKFQVDSVIEILELL